MAQNDLHIASATGNVPTAMTVQDGVQAVAAVSRVRQQLARVYSSSDRVLSRAEAKALDPDATAADMGAHAQQARAALAATELLGKLTGELQQERTAAGGPVLVVVMPGIAEIQASGRQYSDIDAVVQSVD